MSDRKTKWEMLNESLGFPLGVKSAASLGLSGGFSTLEEGKKKKKMDLGVEVPADDEAGDDAELDSDADDVPADDAGGCKCDSPVAKGDEGDAAMMCKKCSKKMKKGMKKKMKNEDIFSGYEHTLFQQTADVGSDAYREEFWRSLNSAFADPRKRNFGGVNLDEEVVFQPDEEIQAAAEPKPGQPGFAPMSRIGVTAKPETPVSSWEQGWAQIAEAMQGLSAKVDAISKKTR